MQPQQPLPQQPPAPAPQPQPQPLITQQPTTQQAAMQPQQPTNPMPQVQYAQPQQMPPVMQGQPLSQQAYAYPNAVQQPAQKSLKQLLLHPYVLASFSGSFLAFLGSILKWVASSGSLLSDSYVASKMSTKYTFTILVALIIAAAVVASIRFKLRFLLPVLWLVVAFNLLAAFNQRIAEDEKFLVKNTVGWYISMLGLVVQIVAVVLVSVLIFKLRKQSVATQPLQQPRPM